MVVMKEVKHTITWGRQQEVKCTSTGHTYVTFKGKRLYLDNYGANPFVRCDSMWGVKPPSDIRYEYHNQYDFFSYHEPVASAYNNMNSVYFLFDLPNDKYIVCLCTWSDL